MIILLVVIAYVHKGSSSRRGREFTYWKTVAMVVLLRAATTSRSGPLLVEATVFGIARGHLWYMLRGTISTGVLRAFDSLVVYTCQLDR